MTSLSARKNLVVYWNTVVVGVEMNEAKDAITSVHGVQRSVYNMNVPFSQQVEVGLKLESSHYRHHRPPFHLHHSFSRLRLLHHSRCPRLNFFVACDVKPLQDWYSTSPSSTYPTKVSLTFVAASYVDATEFGDLMKLVGKFEVADSIGAQCIAFTFILQKNSHIKLREPDDALLSTEVTANYSLGQFTWDQVWSYRSVGDDVTLVAWGAGKY